MRARSRHFDGKRPNSRHGEAGCEELLMQVRKIDYRPGGGAPRPADTGAGEENGIDQTKN
jgi:hypothetical protein